MGKSSSGRQVDGQTMSASRAQRLHRKLRPFLRVDLDCGIPGWRPLRWSPKRGPRPTLGQFLRHYQIRVTDG